MKTMKRRFEGGLGLALLCGLLGCVDLDEDLVGVLSTSFFATPAGLDAAVNATYSELRSFFGREESMGLAQMGTDTWTAVGGGKQHFDRYDAALNASDSWVRLPWQRFYRGINTANAVIDRAEAINGMDPIIKAHRIAEARFLRALFYFYLVQLYGDLHLTLHENVGVQTDATRTPATEVYDAIIADLQAAALVLPVTQLDQGRATLGAAQHLLAKVYLTRAYRPYAVNGDFARAAELAKTVINSGRYSLLPNYAALFCAPNSGSGYCNLNGYNEVNPELIFSVQFSHNADFYGNGSGNRLHLWFLSSYDDYPGLPRDLNNGRAQNRVRPTTYGSNLWQRWSGQPGSTAVMDTRYDASFQTVWYATVAANGQNGRRLNPGDTALWHPGYEVTPAFRASKAYIIITPSQYDGLRYPSLKKYQDNQRPTFNQEDGGKDYALARLAETYLIAAEALIGAGNVAEATTYINSVRRRAAGPGLQAAMEVTPAQVNLDFLLDERERELAGELHRWFDLVRTNKLIERVRLFNAQAVGIQPYHALRPIPQAQIDLTSRPFAQNPGY